MHHPHDPVSRVIHSDEMRWDPLVLFGSSLPSLLHWADMKKEHILFWFMPGRAISVAFRKPSLSRLFGEEAHHTAQPELAWLLEASEFQSSAAAEQRKTQEGRMQNGFRVF